MFGYIVADLGNLSEEEKKISELTNSLAELNDKHLRLRAEFDNFRKRTQKEMEHNTDSVTS